jgi:hypothetical protein
VQKEGTQWKNLRDYEIYCSITPTTFVVLHPFLF